MLSFCQVVFERLELFAVNYNLHANYASGQQKTIF